MEQGYGRFVRRRGIQIALLSVITVAAMLCSILNAAGMRETLEDSASEYCNSITGQITQGIRDGIDYKMTEVLNVADSLEKVFAIDRETELEEFLTRKAKILGFDELILFERDGEYKEGTAANRVDLDLRELAGMEGVQLAFQNEVHMGFCDGQTLYYAAPVRVSGEVQNVLVGLRSKENLQSMIVSQAFQGNTLSCIVSSKGEVILSPTDLKPFTYLDSIFHDPTQTETAEKIREMQENLLGGEDGVLRFTDVNGGENMLSYNSLGLNDWFVLTIVPLNLISGGVSSYMFRSFLIMGGMVVVFLLFLLMIYRVFSDNQRRLTALAFEDSVTGGMNDAAFRLKYNAMVHEIGTARCAIVLLNVKNFKLINEKLGFAAGNEILRDISRVITAHLDSARWEFSARGENDHFFLCLQESDPAVIRDRISQITEVVSRSWNTSRRCQVSFVAGCCLVDSALTVIRVLQDRARIAMRDEGGKGQQNCVFYDESIARRVKREQELDEMFEEAIAGQEFQIYFQPKVDLRRGRPEGAEALVRWQHPRYGVIPPADFIPLFEHNGKICRLDYYVFEEVCKFFRRRQAAGKKWYPVSVNLSRYHFYEDDCLEKFYEIYRAYDMPAGSIEFELTESMFFDSKGIEFVKKGIKRMHEMGFRCSMDDFGAGYSSLGLLKEFDVDTLKLDRSFFLDISSERARDIIKSVVELAAKLHVATVAEGIEESEQMDFLYSINCDIVQGYYFSKPLPADEFERWMSRYE